MSFRIVCIAHLPLYGKNCPVTLPSLVIFNPRLVQTTAWSIVKMFFSM